MEYFKLQQKSGIRARLRQARIGYRGTNLLNVRSCLTYEIESRLSVDIFRVHEIRRDDGDTPTCARQTEFGQLSRIKRTHSSLAMDQHSPALVELRLDECDGGDEVHKNVRFFRVIQENLVADEGLRRRQRRPRAIIIAVLR
jgi:hypothetical protein